MPRRKKTVKPLPTIWRVPDDLWAEIELMLVELDPPEETGRTRCDPRPLLNGILYHLRSGCQWNELPAEFGDDSTIHRPFQRWLERGVLEAIGERLVRGCDEWGGVDWEWQAADGVRGKARSGGCHGQKPPDRGKNGVKRSLLVEATGSR